MKNTDCLAIKNLFSPVLDEEISPEELEIFQNHLKNCKACQEEWQQWQSISSSLKKSQWEYEVPSNFTQKVISKIEDNNLKKFNFFYKHLKTLGSVAAVIAIFIGSLTVISEYNQTPEANKLKMIATESEVNEQNSEDGTVSSTSSSDPLTTKTGESKENTTKENEETTPEQNSSNNQNEEGIAPPDNENKNNSSSDIKENTSSKILETSEEAVPTVSLASKEEIKIEHTLLKLSTNNPSGTISKAYSLALEKGATVNQNTFGSYSQISTVTINVSENSKDSLLQGLCGLGTVISKNVEPPTDLTYRYKEAVARCQELQALFNSDSKNSALQTEYTTLRQQIKDWEAQDDRHIITLWIEKS